jgi:lipoprotein-releasing system permease protein
MRRMFHPLSVFLGARYASARRRRGYLSFITSVAIGGLALGTAVLVLVLSVLNGFERELRERVLAVLPQLVLYHEGTFADWQAAAARVRGVQGVQGVAPLVTGPVLVATVQGVRAAQLSGIDPVHEGEVSIVGRFVVGTAPGAGAGLDALAPAGFRALLGSSLARELGVRVGDRVTVVMSEAAVTPLGVFPRQKRFVVAGIVDSGTEVDGQALYVHIDDAQRLYRLGTAVHAIRVRLDDLFMAPVAAMDARAMLAPDPVQARDWTDTHGTLYQAIVLQRTTMLMLLSLVIAVAAYNVVSSLVMVVTDKQREIAILRSLGFGRAGVLRSFLVLGSIVGIVGVGLGSALGLAAAYGVADAVAALQQAFGLQLLAQYFIHYLPSAPRLGDVAIVAAIALVLTLLASLYPAWRAARLSPTEILRHE